MKILLVEDMAGFGLPIKEELEASGHTVTWIIGAQRLQPDRITGILASKNARPMEDSWGGDPTRLIEIDLSGFELAFVDGGLIGPIHDGSAIVPTLVARGIVCCAITGGAAGNHLLLDAGAQFGMPKELVLLALRTGAFAPRAAVSHRKRAGQRLARWVARTHREREQANRQGRHFDTGFACLSPEKEGRR